METVKPDGRGRIPLSRYVKDVRDHYLISVSPNGVVTLIPATVRPAILDDLEEVSPGFARALEAAVAGKAAPSVLWKELDGERRPST